MPAVLSDISWKTSIIERALPLLSYIDTPSFDIALYASPLCFCILTRIAFNAVPASLPFVPLFANTPKTAALSSIGEFRFFSTPPTPKYASCNCMAV